MCTNDFGRGGHAFRVFADECRVCAYEFRCPSCGLTSVGKTCVFRCKTCLFWYSVSSERADVHE